MCGRFTIMLEPEELRQQLNLGDLPVEFVSNRNISPGQPVPVVIDVETRHVALYRWGLIPRWAKEPSIGYKMFNARSETVAQKPSFKIPFLRQRCLIPADGFYEWRVEDGKKYPYLFTLKDGQAFTFAGLWQKWVDASGGELRTCTLITTEPNQLISNYHDRMPVILAGEDRWDWLRENTITNLQSMMIPLPEKHFADPVRIDRL